MMYVDKAEVIQECIEKLRRPIRDTSDSVLQERLYDGIEECLEALEQFKADVDALALQEAESHAKDVLSEMVPSDEVMIPVGVPGAYYEVTEEEFNKEHYRQNP